MAGILGFFKALIYDGWSCNEREFHGWLDVMFVTSGVYSLFKETCLKVTKLFSWLFVTMIRLLIFSRICHVKSCFKGSLLVILYLLSCTVCLSTMVSSKPALAATASVMFFWSPFSHQTLSFSFLKIKHQPCLININKKTPRFWVGRKVL